LRQKCSYPKEGKKLGATQGIKILPSVIKEEQSRCSNLQLNRILQAIQGKKIY
jgi:hypothetical protein